MRTQQQRPQEPLGAVRLPDGALVYRNTIPIERVKGEAIYEIHGQDDNLKTKIELETNTREYCLKRLVVFLIMECFMGGFK